jgi:anti-sigma-K factor RskA
MSAHLQDIPEEDRMLAAEFALGVLQGPEREAFAQRLKNEPALAAAVRTWDEDFSSFADDIKPVAPPQRLQQQLQKRLFADAAPPAKSSLWVSLSFWRGLALASVLGLIAVGGFNLREVVFPSAPETALVAQLTGDAKAVTLVAYYDAAKGELRLNRTEGSPAAGRSFELWLIAGNDAPVSLGLLPLDANKTLTVPANLQGKFKDGVLAVSDEPAGGSQTGAPTGAVLATGKLTSV